jgi:outer membrane immunogenic protein
MKTSVFAGISLGAVALAGGAQAADLAYKAPVAAPVPFSWTGFYLGANVGGASARSTISDTSDFPWFGNPVDANKTGVIGGLQAGINWQINSLVLGVEGDISFASVNRSVDFTTLFTTPGLYSSNLKNLGTVRGRIGLAFDRLLVYGTGGAAFANIDNAFRDLDADFGASPSSRVTGWVAGGGVEYAITDHWTARAEYLHADFGERTARVNTGGADYAFAFKNTIDIGRAGINYKF